MYAFSWVWIIWLIVTALVLWGIFAWAARIFRNSHWAYPTFPYQGGFEPQDPYLWLTSPRKALGKGPKNYIRPDDRILDDINGRLTINPMIDASEMEVHVQDGLVELNGTVHSRLEKRWAESTIDSVAGVKDVKNNLVIKD